MTLKEEFLKVYEGAMNSNVDDAFIGHFLNALLYYTAEDLRKIIKKALYDALTEVPEPGT